MKEQFSPKDAVRWAEELIKTNELERETSKVDDEAVLGAEDLFSQTATLLSFDTQKDMGVQFATSFFSLHLNRSNLTPDLVRSSFAYYKEVVRNSGDFSVFVAVDKITLQDIDTFLGKKAFEAANKSKDIPEMTDEKKELMKDFSFLSKIKKHVRDAIGLKEKSTVESVDSFLIEEHRKRDGVYELADENCILPYEEGIISYNFFLNVFFATHTYRHGEGERFRSEFYEWKEEMVKRFEDKKGPMSKASLDFLIGLNLGKAKEFVERKEAEALEARDKAERSQKEDFAVLQRRWTDQARAVKAAELNEYIDNL